MTDSDSQPETRPDPALTATAYHEAGHALMAFLRGRPVEKITIAPAHMQTGGFRLGACRIQKGRVKATKDPVEDEVMILLAGIVAESHFTHRYNLEGAAHDLSSVTRILSRRVTRESQLQRLTKRMLQKTEHLLNDQVNRTAIKRIAAELLTNETISGRVVRHLHSQATQEL